MAHAQTVSSRAKLKQPELLEKFCVGGKVYSFHGDGVITVKNFGGSRSRFSKIYEDAWLGSILLSKNPVPINLLKTCLAHVVSHVGKTFIQDCWYDAESAEGSFNVVKPVGLSKRAELISQIKNDPSLRLVSSDYAFANKFFDTGVELVPMMANIPLPKSGKLFLVKFVKVPRTAKSVERDKEFSKIL